MFSKGQEVTGTLDSNPVEGTVVRAGKKNTRVDIRGTQHLLPTDSLSPKPSVSITSVVTETTPAPPASSLEGRLSGAAKPQASSATKGRLTLQPTEELAGHCRTYIRNARDEKEAARDKVTALADIKKAVIPFRTAELEKDGATYATAVDVPVEFEGTDRKVQIQFKNVFSPFRPDPKVMVIVRGDGEHTAEQRPQTIDDVQDELTGIVGEQLFPKLFQRKRSLAIKGEVMKDERKLDALLTKLEEAGIPLAEFFDYKVEINAAGDFSSQQYKVLSGDQRKELRDAGLHQNVTPMVR